MKRPAGQTTDHCPPLRWVCTRCSVALEAKQPRLTAMKCGSEMRLTRVNNELQHLMLNQGMQKKQKLWSAEGRARVPVRRAANRMSLSLTTPSPLLTDNICADYTSRPQLFPLQSRGGPYILGSDSRCGTCRRSNVCYQPFRRAYSVSAQFMGISPLP
jgi:hypothetical protein